MKTIKKVVYSNETITDLVEKVELQMWDTIAKTYSNIKSGDFPIFETIGLTEIINNSIKLWLKINTESEEVTFE